jgi:cupin 2 domain-containing protein
MTNEVKNIFAGVAPIDGAEQLAALFENAALRIEKIVSHSHSSAEGFWYDQSQDEWVIVLRGAATLEFPAGELIDMNEGDYLTIPRHVKHRVRRTSPETVWLAVHMK